MLAEEGGKDKKNLAMKRTSPDLIDGGIRLNYYGSYEVGDSKK
jgi:hypothetical protein